MKSNLALVFGVLYAIAIGSYFAAKVTITCQDTRRKLNANEATIRNANAPYTWGM